MHFYRAFLGNILNLWGHRFLLIVPDEESILRIIERHPLYSGDACGMFVFKILFIFESILDTEKQRILKALEYSKSPPPPPVPSLTDDEL